MTSFKDARRQRQARQAPHAQHGVARSIALQIPAQEDEQVHDEAEIPPLIHKADKVQVDMAPKAAPLADLSKQLRLDDAYLQVRITPNAGRALYAKRRYKAGQSTSEGRVDGPGAVIYTSPFCPPATALSTQHLTTHCSSCFLSAEDAAVLRKRNEESMKRCGACKIVHYCSSVRIVGLAGRSELTNRHVSWWTGQLTSPSARL